MSRERAPFQAVATWRSKGLYIWGWNSTSVASSAWFYSGYGHGGWSQGWDGSPLGWGQITKLDLELPDGGARNVSAVRLDPAGAIEWLSDPPPDAGPSVVWFADLARYARHIVAAGRVTPAVVDEGPFTVARWKVVWTDEMIADVRHAAASAPLESVNGFRGAVTDIVDAMVDGANRDLLHRYGWKPELGRGRNADTQALRAVFAALAKPDPTIRSGTPEFHDALDVLRADLVRQAARLSGEPVVRGRVRLTLPDDPLEPWLVELELVDEADPSRWCSAADVWTRAERAVDLAATPEHFDLLADACRALAAIAAEVDVLASLAEREHPDFVELDLDEAAEFIDIAPAVFESAGIELLGPEQLVKASVRVSGTASAPADNRPSRFGREALVKWSATIDDTPMSPADLERAAATGASLLRSGHRWVRIDPAGLRRARQTLEEYVDHHSTVSSLELLRLASGEADPNNEVDVTVTGAGFDDPDTPPDTDPISWDWVQRLLAGLPDESLEEAKEPPSFVGELRHYQRRGLTWLQFLEQAGLGGCLADDMGLGKTATTLAYLAERPGPHLVVCPLSVVHNWEAEAHRFTPHLSVVIHHGADRHSTQPALFGLRDADLVITTYGLLPRDLVTLRDIDWATVVLDEAQMVKNPSTKAAKAVRALPAKQKLALTGTPVENRLLELWAILDAVNPGLLGSQQRFRSEFAAAIERDGDELAAARLRRLTRPFVLRRTKADKRLLPDLPDKIEQIAYATLTKEQAMLYQKVVDQLLDDAEKLTGMQRRGNVLAALTRLKQICNHPAQALKDASRLEGRSGKLNRFDELVENLLDLDERALVFTQFVEMGVLLQQHIESRFAIEAPFLAGSVTRQRRERMVAEFQNGVGPPLLIVSLKAGGTGLNLTAASQVIHYDRWWNPAVEDQATDRAWRLGQSNTVYVHKLVCEGTVEERIGQVIDDKRALADAVIGTGEAWLSELSTDQLAELVRLDGGGS